MSTDKNGESGESQSWPGVQALTGKLPQAWLTRNRLGVVVFLLLGALAPVLSPSAYVLHLEVLVVIYLVLVLGMHLLSGVTGQMSFGQSAFMAIGAYSGALAIVRGHVPYLVGALAAIGSSVLVAVVLGPALMRLLGDYFIIATIALVQVVYLVILNSQAITGGPLGLSGVPSPSIGGLVVSNDHEFYYLTLAIAFIALVGVLNLGRSRVGRALVAIKNDELAARSFGIHVQYYKVVVLGLSGALAGVSGLLFASYASYINPVDFDYNLAVSFAIILIVGGLGSLPGAIAGTVLVTLSPEFLRSLGQWRLVLYGGVLVLLMALRPQGLFGDRFDTGRPAGRFDRVLGLMIRRGRADGTSAIDVALDGMGDSQDTQESSGRGVDRD